MHLKMVFMLLGLALLQLTQAFPAGDDWVVLGTQETENGTLTFLTPPSPQSPQSPTLVKRLEGTAPPCKKLELLCDDHKYMANVKVCSSLINTMTKHAEWGVGTAPRSICLQQGDERCCVSWAAPVFRNFRQGHLVAHARRMLDTCKRVRKEVAADFSGWRIVGEYVSSLARNVQINDVCTSECLSSVPNKCEGE